MDPGKNKTVVVVAGPTASGKTAVAIELAKYFKTEIISADSRQCYRELNIGVARPASEELEQIKHYFIASHSIHDDINAGVFENYALAKASLIFKRKDIVIMVGGTGLYIKAFCEGLDEIPFVDPDLRKVIVDNYNKEGLSWLQEQINKKDPLFYREGEVQNPQRLMRALEVFESTGRSIFSFRKGKKAERDFNILKIGLELPKENLYININARVDKMMNNGLADEVKQLLPYKGSNALHTVGYTELFDALAGKYTMEETIEKIKTNTRQYAKRQMTWFKKDKMINWLSPLSISEIITFIERLL